MISRPWELVPFVAAAVASASFMSFVRSSYVPTDRIYSRVTKHIYAGRDFFVKRDDENSIQGFQVPISGNKSRKLLYLSDSKPFPKILASYGGSQSNSMLAIAKIVAASSSQSKFYYFLKPLPKFLKSSPNGNLKAALTLGMQLVEISPDMYDELVSTPKTSFSVPESVLSHLNKEISKGICGGISDPEAEILSSDAYWLPQGAAMPEAEEGVEQLVHELRTYIQESDASSDGLPKKWKVVFASGTGTMAMFAARHFALKNSCSLDSFAGADVRCTAVSNKDDSNGVEIKDQSAFLYSDRDIKSVRSSDRLRNLIDVEVVAVPCVGSVSHLLDQMRTLDLVSGEFQIFPTILKTHRDVPSSGSSENVRVQNVRTFGEPCADHYRVWSELKSETGLDFDLIYTPRTFELLLESFKYDVELWKDCNILYYHCGGVEGNDSQLGRYRFQKII